MKSDPKAVRDEVVLRGQLTTTVLVDLLRTAEASGRDTLIRFVTELGKAYVVFRNGELFDARMGASEGEAAVLRLLGLSDGRFEVVHKRAEGQRTINSSVMGLVRARERRLKRWSELAERAPSLTSVIGIDRFAADSATALTTSQRDLLALVNDRRTVLEVLEASGREAVEALEDLVALHELNLVVRQQQSGFPPPENTPGETPSPLLLPAAPAIPGNIITDVDEGEWGDQSASAPQSLPRNSARNVARSSPRNPPVPIIDVAGAPGPAETDVSPAQPQRPPIPGSHPKSPSTRPAPVSASCGVDVSRVVDVNSARPTAVELAIQQMQSTQGSPEELTHGPHTVRIPEQSALRDLSKTVRLPPEPAATEGHRDLGRTLRIPVDALHGAARDLNKTVRLKVGIAETLALAPEAPLPGPRAPMASELGLEAQAEPALAFDRPFVGRYQVLCRIGRGGMGSVYLCRLTGDGGFRRLFALKVLRDSLSQEPGFIQRFLEEANLAARVDHPNVVSVVDAAVHAGQPYLVMHYVEGTSLFHMLRKSSESRPPRLILPIVMGALQGLHAAHSLLDETGQAENLVHCDVSPDNLLVGIDGVCRIADFGVARTKRLVVHPGADHTRGKPAYVAPEIITGSVVDARSDLFSLGVVLYNALTGIELFSAPTQEQVLENVLREPIRPPSTVGLHPPASLDPIVMRALERDPARRYPSAEAMLIDLRRVAISEDLMAPESEIGRWVREAAGSELELRRLASLDASMKAQPVRPITPSLTPPALPVYLPDREDDMPMTEKLATTTVLSLPRRSRSRDMVLLAAGLTMLGIIAMTLLWPSWVGKKFKIDERRIYPTTFDPDTPVPALSSSAKKKEPIIPQLFDTSDEIPGADPNKPAASGSPAPQAPLDEPDLEQKQKEQP